MNRGGMKDANENILCVPNPHADCCDVGGNWAMCPIMTRGQMVNWDGGACDVATWAGETIEEGANGSSGDHWVDGKSKYTAEEAEQPLFSRMKPEDIEICSASDLKKIAEGIRLLGPAIANCHTRTPDDSEYKFKIGDLVSSVEDSIAKSKTNEKKIRGGIQRLEIRHRGDAETTVRLKKYPKCWTRHCKTMLRRRQRRWQDLWRSRRTSPISRMT